MSKPMAISKQQIPVEAGKLPLTVAAAGGVGAVVVIMPSAFGVGPDLEAQMEELARDASAVVALDPFFREDAGPVPYEDRGRAIGRLQALDKPRGYRDRAAAATHGSFRALPDEGGRAGRFRKPGYRTRL